MTMKAQEAAFKKQEAAQEQIRVNQRLQQEILEEKLRQLRSRRLQSSSSQASRRSTYESQSERLNEVLENFSENHND